jgi:hypothetical protein
MVIAPTRTGRNSSRSVAVTATVHTNSGILSCFVFLGLILIFAEKKADS